MMDKFIKRVVLGTEVYKSFAENTHTQYMLQLLNTPWDNSDLVEKRSQIIRWYSSLALRKSNCDQNIVSFSLLPNIEDIKSKKLSSVIIKDFSLKVSNISR